MEYVQPATYALAQKLESLSPSDNDLTKDLVEATNSTALSNG